MKRLIVPLLVWVLLPATALAESRHFPRPASLEPDVQFWLRVYTEVSTNGGLIHDSRDLSVIYEKIEFADGLSRNGRERETERKKKAIATALRKLATGKRTGLSRHEQRVLDLWPQGVSNATLRAAASRVRFQLGQADKFRAGVIRSGVWAAHIQETLHDMGLPEEIAALPHVESSYTPHAYSRVGAAGLWQFTRSTGRRFMRVDHVIDERLDPFKATVAAARLLKQNRETTGSWPLAITAYNHGAAGMRRASRQLGTTDITTIVRKYRSRTFGFASRNFYVEFLAAVDIHERPEKYFGALRLDTPENYAAAELPYYTTASALARALGVSPNTLKSANPSLLATVWTEAKYVPRGFVVHIPHSELAQPIEVALAQIPQSQQFAAQTRDLYYQVQRGDSLSVIARRNQTTVSELMRLNGLPSRHRIRAGQKIRLPQDGRSVRVASVARPVTPMVMPADGLYTVQSGDTLNRISRTFDVSEQELMRMNSLSSPHRIYVGQTLQVGPTAEKPPTQVAAIETAPVPPPEASDPHPQIVADVTPAKAASNPGDSLPVGEVELDESEIRDALLADPSDYSVASDGSIEVQPTETLGHYAEWLGVRASRLRQINHLEYGRALPMSHRLKLDFSHVTPEEFERQRMAYHKNLQEEFFERFEIDGTTTHITRRGDSLWTLAQRTYRVPIWLIRQYNPDTDLDSLSKGTKITIPKLKRHDGLTSETRAS